MAQAIKRAPHREETDNLNLKWWFDFPNEGKA
jgi:hypothetical protein